MGVSRAAVAKYRVARYRMDAETKRQGGTMASESEDRCSAPLSYGRQVTRPGKATDGVSEGIRTLDLQGHNLAC